LRCTSRFLPMFFHLAVFFERDKNFFLHLGVLFPLAFPSTRFFLFFPFNTLFSHRLVSKPPTPFVFACVSEFSLECVSFGPVVFWRPGFCFDSISYRETPFPGSQPAFFPTRHFFQPCHPFFSFFLYGFETAFFVLLCLK